jgi:hypothetical protein
MLYQLSYASGPEGAIAKIDSGLGGCQDRASRGCEKAAEEVNTTFWLPLPERVGGDREEPPHPHGFVDRAYFVFLTILLLTTTAHLRDTDWIEVLLTPFSPAPLVQ